MTPNFKIEFSIYNATTRKFQDADSFNEAVRIARRLQVYGFKAHVDITTWRNCGTPQAIASGKSFWFNPDGTVEIFDAYTNYFRKGRIVRTYFHFY